MIKELGLDDLILLIPFMFLVLLLLSWLKQPIKQQKLSSNDWETSVRGFETEMEKLRPGYKNMIKKARSK
jgi:hypothetical protein